MKKIRYQKRKQIPQGARIVAEAAAKVRARSEKPGFNPVRKHALSIKNIGEKREGGKQKKNSFQRKESGGKIKNAAVGVLVKACGLKGGQNTT